MFTQVSRSVGEMLAIWVWREVCTWVSSNLESSIHNTCAELCSFAATVASMLNSCPFGLRVLFTSIPWWKLVFCNHCALTAQTSAERIASRASPSGAPFTFTAMWGWIMPCFTLLKYIHQHARPDSSSYCVCRPNVVQYCWLLSGTSWPFRLHRGQGTTVALDFENICYHFKSEFCWLVWFQRSYVRTVETDVLFWPVKIYSCSQHWRCFIFSWSGLQCLKEHCTGAILRAKHVNSLVCTRCAEKMRRTTNESIHFPNRRKAEFWQ